MCDVEIKATINSSISSFDMNNQNKLGYVKSDHVKFQYELTTTLTVTTDTLSLTCGILFACNEAFLF